MKFAAGYQPPQYGQRFPELTESYREHLSEVFFPWPGAPSGRPPVLTEAEFLSHQAEDILCRDLRDIQAQGIGLDLLMNANCYGEKAVSRQFEQEIRDQISRMTDLGCKPQIVTTTSLFVAQTFQTWFPEIEVRASVNMRIGTTQAMGYVAELFDSFYLQRDLQRNLDHVRDVRAWCDAHGKKLCMLANSGCLRFCPGQSFHDNLIAHCAEAEQLEPVRDFNPHVCWRLYRSRDNWAEILKATWVRPEDLHHYEGLVDVVKLATRQHSHPQSVLGAYTSGHWDGNLLDLLEPGFSPAFYPWYLDNQSFPPDFFQKTGQCANGCTQCGYCEQVLQQALHRYDLF